ncbi:PREDICTED: beta-1,4-galactosyltransferase 4-like [Branchiostoma belcheri]|uniref:Beta-1,4-galactosyltransferase n=1 Tax=Branchiostoma belcheri TaxID=7741 RepID=A0A6P4ZII5_BRABE|nr:PREDICTED: beta-1,4-galactosyltransferase 4-like [Branchiostoma belcheri]
MRKTSLRWLILLQVVATLVLTIYLHLVKTPGDRKTLQKPLRAENPYENVGYGGKWSPTGRTSSSSSERVDILTTHLHLVKTPGDRETLQKSVRAENPYEQVHVGYAGKWSPPRRTRSSSSEKVAVLTTHLHLVKTPGDRETLQKPLRAENPYGNVRYGGKWSPPARNRSSSSEKIAVLVTFRDREKHLDIFLRHMHPFLQRQGLDYTIYVIEQHGDEPTFCKGLLYNVGFTEALKEDPTYDCFIFHDVDLLPEDDRNLYTCSQSPYHLSVAVDTLNYSLPYQELFGGVSALKTWHYKLVNGYSNLFCGWGGEDDDMAIRLKLHLLKLSRPSKDVARYKMLRHNKTERNPQRYDLLTHWIFRTKRGDGLKSLYRNGFTITSTSHRELYTHILVNIHKREALAKDFTSNRHHW